MATDLLPFSLTKLLDFTRFYLKLHTSVPCRCCLSTFEIISMQGISNLLPLQAKLLQCLFLHRGVNLETFNMIQSYLILLFQCESIQKSYTRFSRIFQIYIIAYISCLCLNEQCLIYFSLFLQLISRFTSIFLTQLPLIVSFSTVKFVLLADRFWKP